MCLRNSKLKFKQVYLLPLWSKCTDSVHYASSTEGSSVYCLAFSKPVPSQNFFISGITRISKNSLHEPEFRRSARHLSALKSPSVQTFPRVKELVHWFIGTGTVQELRGCLSTTCYHIPICLCWWPPNGWPLLPSHSSQLLGNSPHFLSPLNDSLPSMSSKTSLSLQPDVTPSISFVHFVDCCLKVAN